MEECLQSRIAKLEAIVDKLPKTDDGVPVVPGLEVWINHEQYTGRLMVVMGHDRWPSGKPSWHLRLGTEDNTTAGRLGWCGLIYSTKEAAVAAQGAK